jgi:D-alanyl-D-alanine dipeptidase
MGYTLKVYDCYRPQRAVDEFVTWAADLADQTMKPEFYPRVDKSALFDDGYIAERSGHSRGSTLDVTLVALPPAVTPPYVQGQPLVDCAAPQAIRFPDNSLDMGTGFDCFDTLTHTADPRISGDQAKNRLLLGEGLERQGFVNYDKEWWHFTFKPADTGEPYPDTYFDFPVD